MLKRLSYDQRFVLVVLFLINFFNYVDRQIIFPLFHNIQTEFGISDFKLGLLGTVFMLVHSLASLPMGILADRYQRKYIIAWGVGFWSLATLASGFVRSFRSLLAVRSLVGIGEASYAPAATAIISDDFPEDVRAQAQGVYNIGMFAGGTIGAMLGGAIASYFGSWRLAFFLVAIPGVILAFLSLRLRDDINKSQQTWVSIGGILKSWIYIWILISATLVTFAGGAYISWGVEFLRRYKNYSLLTASLSLGLVFLLAGILGVMIGSYLADHLQRKIKYGRALVVAVSLIVSAPLVLLGIASNGSWFLVWLFIGTMLISFYQGPITVVIHDTIPKHMWATAFSLYLLVAHLLGDTIAPAIIGKISDQYNLKIGLEWSTLLILLSGLSFLVVCYLINRDRSFGEKNF